MSLLRSCILFAGLWFVVAADAVMACPDPNLNAAAQMRSNGAALRLGQSRRAVAGGTVPLAGCPGVPLEEVPSAMFLSPPSLSANLGGMLGLAIEISVDAPCATALLVRTAAGEWYHDDRGQGPGKPRIILRHPGSGTLRLWLGTSDGAPCTARVQLVTYAG